MKLYRISREQYASDLSGEGAARAGGRWNNKGSYVVYASDSTALATLEALVHAPLNMLPGKMAIACFELPDFLHREEIKLSELPGNWNLYPAPEELAEIGYDWIKRRKSVALSVPSAIIPFAEGKNYLLNPLHPDFKKVKLLKIIPYTFNDRFFKK